jgi:hypothetical protein
VTVKATSGPQPLPGVAILIRSGDKLKAATSTDVEGKVALLFDPDSSYQLSAELTAFATAERDLTTGPAPCDSTIEFNLALRPKDEPVAQATPTTPVAATPSATGQPPAVTAGQPAATGQPPAAGRGTGASSAGTAAGRSGRPGQQAPEFSTLTVQADANGQATLDATPPDVSSTDLSRLLPPGFSLQNAQADAVGINGSGDAVSVDRGAMNDRAGALGRGEIDPTTGQPATGFGPGGGGGDAGGGRGGQGGGPGGGRGGRGGGGGPGFGGFGLGGRAGRGQSPYQGNLNYTYGGSGIDSTPLTVQRGSIIAAANQPFNQNNAGFTIGGPVKIPGLYADANRRTSFQLNYTGNHTTTAASQVLSVPTDAERNGDFSASSIQLINPSTGQPFLNNQIPSNLVNPVSQSLLQYIPHATDQTTDQANLVAQGITLATSNAISLRLIQNLSPTVATGGGGRGGGLGGGGRGGGRGGRGLSIVLNGQLQYRQSSNQTFNAVPMLGGTSQSRSITAPISLNISHGRTVHTFSISFTHSKSSAANSFENGANVSGLAGIQYPSNALTDPFNFGVPNLSFSSFSGIRPATASQRTDNRITSSYTYSRTISKHQLQVGADFRDDRSSTETNSNARGSFQFSGLYTTNGAQTAGTSGADFADFLLGLPQQATLQVGGLTHLREHAFDAYLNDNWQKNSRLTFSLGLRYELTLPYVETSGLMANLDVAPNFTAVSVVCGSSNPACPNAPLTGPFTGSFPAGLLNPDTTAIGPKFGFVYRLARNTLLRGGYTISYNLASYASIARQLVGQPPFAVALTNVGTLQDPLVFQTALLQQQQATTNNFGVDPNYVPGMWQTYNATFSRDFTRNITFIAGYTGVKGTNLDLERAPNRNADGTLRIAGVQPFIWESSGAHSLLNLANFQLRRRYANGFSAGINYTLRRSMDNASSLGAGQTVVAQNDQNLAAEYALSSGNQTHVVSADFTWELPFGANRRWLADPGFLGAIVGEWAMTLTFNAHSGSPFTPSVVGATSSIASNTSGSLRANLIPGVPIQLTDPALGDFFNTSAFAVPAIGSFGTSPRNVIIGPGGHVVNATFSRDMRIGGNRAVSLQISANNLFNTIQWTSIDTNLLSRTFGQVTRVAPMRTLIVNLRLRF